MLQWHPRMTAVLVVLVLVALAIVAGTLELDADWASNFNW